MSCPWPLLPGSSQEQGAAPLTLEEIDPLVAVVAVRRESEGSVDAVWDALKAVGDVAGVPGVQGSVVKAPVLAALGGCQAEWGQGAGCSIPQVRVCPGEQVEAEKPRGEVVAAWGPRQAQEFGDIWQPLCVFAHGGVRVGTG